MRLRKVSVTRSLAGLALGVFLATPGWAVDVFSTDGGYLGDFDIRPEADLQGVVLRAADLRGATLAGADLRDADLAGADLRDADLRYTDLAGAALAEVDLSFALLISSNLWGANLEGANLSNAALDGATLYFTNLDGVDAPFCSFRQATFRRALMRHANLVSSSFDDAEVTALDLVGSDLRGVRDLDTTSFFAFSGEPAPPLYDAETQFSEDFDPEVQGWEFVPEPRGILLQLAALASLAWMRRRA